MRIAIVGGGAAGLMAAASALDANPTAKVFLLERNDALGKKVVISGGGRCNVTTGLDDVRAIQSRYPRGGKFLTSAFHKFPPAAVRDWFEAHGVPIKIEEDLRAFPVSDNGHDIVAVFERLFEEAGPRRVEVLLKHSVLSIEYVDGHFGVAFRDGEFMEFDRVILTTGGQAYRATGSQGDGYGFAELLGHTITPLAPSLNSFFTKEKWPAAVSGLSFEKATISAAELLGFTRDASKPAASWTGPFLFTHKGVSGPAVFALSSLVAFRPYDAHAPLQITIDLFPDESQAAFTKRVEEAMRANGKKAARTVLAGFVPKSLAELMSHESGADELNAGDLTKAEITAFATWLKAIPLAVIGRGAGDEFVTAGGVSLAEVDPRTMESKITPGLFFAGELLDVDGFTGGFNLQASWATGKLAGESAAQEKTDRA